MDAILSSVVPLRRPCGDFYIVFGVDPPVGRVTLVEALNVAYACNTPVGRSETKTVYLPPLARVRACVYKLRDKRPFVFRRVACVLAILGLATVEECMAAGMYLRELLEKYPEYAKELYAIYFNYCGVVDYEDTIIVPCYITCDQLHILMDKNPSAANLIGAICHQKNDMYCSITARLAYI